MARELPHYLFRQKMSKFFGPTVLGPWTPNKSHRALSLDALSTYITMTYDVNNVPLRRVCRATTHTAMVAIAILQRAISGGRKFCKADDVLVNEVGEVILLVGKFDCVEWIWMMM